MISGYKLYNININLKILHNKIYINMQKAASYMFQKVIVLVVITLGLGEKSLSMKRTNSFLKRFESANSGIRRKRSCQSALVGFCLGRCCGPSYERTAQMWLHYMRSPS